ncbi:MAG: radical SAM protein [Nitrospirota bacterium]
MSINHSHDFFVQWHLTERCNLRCKHCYQSEKYIDEMLFSEIKEVTNEISEMFNAWSETYDVSLSPSFNVTGGEPFLRNDIFEILQEISDKGFDVYLLSNGILINRRKARMLSKIGVKGVQVSIEGPEEVHEKIRGKGSFSASLKGVRYLLDAGIKVTLNVTLSEINADCFIDMVSLSSAVGVQRLGFSRLVPSGRGAGLFNKMLKKEKLKEIYAAISSLDVKGVEIVTGDPLMSQMSLQVDGNKEDSIALGGCAAGVSGITILPDGTLAPCRRLNLSIGNIRRDSLREVWANSEVLSLLRNKQSYKDKCGTCRRWAICRGCRAIAYVCSENGDFLAEDPQCFIG